MARPRSERIEEVKERLRRRLTESVHRPGDRFLSAREVAGLFEVSYQTAHRVIAELSAEGLLERRAASGTYIPGGRVCWDGAHLIFSLRAQREGSFGAQLLKGLTHRFRRDGVSLKVTLGEVTKNYRGYFPVLWESPSVLENMLGTGRPALLLNERPQPGLSATLIDSVSIDDFSGGVGAAQLLLGLLEQPTRHANEVPTVVLAGPPTDLRSQTRVGGFMSIFSNARTVSAGSWYFEDGYRAATQVFDSNPVGLFCVNDRLADAVTTWYRDQSRPLPRLVGFDNAPVAEKLGLTTMAIPWDEFIGSAVELVKRRMNGDVGAARQLILTPRPVVRS